MVIQRIDSKNLLSLYVGDTEDGGNLIISVLEFCLVEQNLDIAIVDDGLFYDWRVYHITEFLSHHACNAVELSHGFIQVFDILCHRG